MATLDDPSSAALARDRVQAALLVLRNSLSIQIALLGVVFVVTGYVIQTGVMAALFPIWGGGLILIGVLSYVAIWRTRR